jgi:hypothetical protein
VVVTAPDTALQATAPFNYQFLLSFETIYLLLTEIAPDFALAQVYTAKIQPGESRYHWWVCRWGSFYEWCSHFGVWNNG